MLAIAAIRANGNARRAEPRFCEEFHPSVLGLLALCIQWAERHILRYSVLRLHTLHDLRRIIRECVLWLVSQNIDHIACPRFVRNAI